MAGLLDALARAVDGAGEADAADPRTEFGRLTTEPVQAVRDELARLRDDRRRRADDLGVLEEQRRAVAAERDDAPAPNPARPAPRAGRAGAPLWRLVRFADGVDDTAAAGVEAALEAAALLDAWVHPADDVTATALDAGEADGYLVPLPEAQRPHGPTLASVLEPDDTGARARRPGPRRAFLDRAAPGRHRAGPGAGRGVGGRPVRAGRAGRHLHQAGRRLRRRHRPRPAARCPARRAGRADRDVAGRPRRRRPAGRPHPVGARRGAGGRGRAATRRTDRRGAPPAGRGRRGTAQRPGRRGRRPGGARPGRRRGRRPRPRAAPDRRRPAAGPRQRRSRGRCGGPVRAGRHPAHGRVAAGRRRGRRQPRRRSPVSSRPPTTRPRRTTRCSRPRPARPKSPSVSPC